jgi:hypothetical protein
MPNNEEKSPETIESKEAPIEINIQYGVEIDADRLKSTIDRLPWYKEKGYSHVKIPDGVSESSTRDEIVELVQSEYSEEKYDEISNKLKEAWPEFSAPFEELKSITDFHFGEKYTIFLTKYGVGGSYHVDANEVIIDIHSDDIEWLMKIMAHEIVHTGIEYLIQKYKVPHWKKERLVDLICEKYFSKRKQGIRENIEDVDEAFYALWPNAEMITKQIGEKI